MLEFDDIQHILLTRTPAITGRYEFLSFDTPAGGRAWLAGSARPGAVRRRCAAPRWTASERWVTLAFTWNGLRALGVAEESLATFPDEFREGMAARAEILGDTGANASRPLGRRPGRRRPARHRHPVRPRPTSSASAAIGGARRAARADCDGVRSLSYLDLERDPAVRLRPRTLRLPRPVVAAGDEGLRRGADARLRRGAEAGRVHPRLSRRGRAGGQSAAARGAVAQRQLHGVSAAGGARRGFPRLPARARPTPRRGRNCWPRSSWAAGAAARRWCWRRTRTIPSSAPTRCATTTSTTRRWTRTATRARWAHMPVGSIRVTPPQNMNRRRMIRRGATYGPALPEGAPDDGVDRGIAAFIICAEPGPPVRVRAERLDQRQDVPRTRQRARPDLRHPGRHTGLHDPEAADPQGAQGHAGLHDAHGRGVLLPARAATRCATSPRSARLEGPR